MATSVQNTSELNTVAQKEFAAWLAEIEPALAREAGDAASAPEVAAWLRLLKEASAGADVAPLLADLTLSPSQVARLFEQASALIPAQNYALLRHLFLLQGRLMAAAPAGEAESKLAALAGLAAQLAQIKQPARLMTQAVAIIARAFGYPSLNLILLLGEGKTLKVQDSLWRNVPPSPKEVKAFAAQISAPQNPIMQAAQTGQSQLSLQPAYTAPPPLTNTAAEIAVPIVLRNRTIGVIHRFSNTPDRLDRSELRMLEAIAGQLAQAIENVQLSATYRKRAQEQRILLESTAALGSSLQTDKIMRLLAVKIAEALNAGACVISQWRADTQTLTVLARHIRAHKDNPATTWRKENKPIPIQRDAVGRQALQTMRPVAVRAGQPDSKPQPWSRPGWQSLLAFPLQTQGEKLGLIEVYDRNRERVFTVDDINLGQALAGQATVVMGQIQMMRDTQYRLAEVSTFYTLSQQLITASPLKLEQLLDNIVNTMRLVADCRACVLFLLDPQEEYLEIKAASGLKKRWKKAARLAVGEGAAGQAVAQKRVIYIPDTTKDPSYVFFDQAVRSIIVVPMLFRGRAIGAINLDDSRPNAFGKSQERLLSIAANQAAIAIQNATLFEQVVSEEQRMRAIIQHMADGLLLLSQTGKIVKINPALTTMLNMHASEIVGQNIYTDHLEPRLAAICTPLTEKKRTGLLTNEVTLPGKPPTILRVFATAVTGDNNRLIGEVRVVHDVTQERELERMKDDFVSIVSHELRTPLFSIQGFVRLMLDDEAPDPGAQREFLTIIERQANQLAELVTNLLDLNKISAGTLTIEKQLVQPLDIINQTVLKLQGFAHREKVHLTSALPASLPPVMGDGQRLEQVLTNLVGNAIKFTPQEGQVSVSAALNGQHITVSVTDTGIGIAPKDLERIFTKFYQVEDHQTRSVQGSGLGLHISKQLIEDHGGKIWAESQLGKGSTFYIQLNVADSNDRLAVDNHVTGAGL